MHGVLLRRPNLARPVVSSGSETEAPPVASGLGIITYNVIEMLASQHDNAAMLPSIVITPINISANARGGYERIVPTVQLTLDPSFCCHHSALFFPKASFDVCQAVVGRHGAHVPPSQTQM